MEKSTMSEELLKKVKNAASVEELLATAKENRIQLSEEKAKEYFERMHASGELADDELESVSGGCGDDPDPPELLSICNYQGCTGDLEKIDDFNFKCKRCGRIKPSSEVWYIVYE